MVKRGLAAAVAAAALAALAVSGPASAADRVPGAEVRDRQARCERLESLAQVLRARIGEIQALQERIRAKLASGELRPPQEARAKHALRKLEALQQDLGQKLARVLALHAEHCTA